MTTINELKTYLEQNRDLCEQLKKLNFKKNVGLNGKTIATEQGREMNKYLNGKLAVINDLLKML